MTDLNLGDPCCDDGSCCGTADSSPTPDAPVPLIAGTFAIYQRTDGGLELVTDVQGRGVESRTVPAAIVKMVTSGKGPVAAMMGRMFG